MYLLKTKIQLHHRHTSLPYIHSCSGKGQRLKLPHRGHSDTSPQTIHHSQSWLWYQVQKQNYVVRMFHLTTKWRHMLHRHRSSLDHLMRVQCAKLQIPFSFHYVHCPLHWTIHRQLSQFVLSDPARELVYHRRAFQFDHTKDPSH